MNYHADNINRKGFTLIEILVVLAVIGLLSALLFPVLGRAREGARTKVCLSNMKQFGLAFQQYVQDAGRRYPGAGQFQKWGTGGHWVKGTNDTNLGSHAGGGKLAYLDDFKPTGSTADVEGGALYSYIRSPQIYICPSNNDGKTKKLSYSMNCALAGMHDVRISEPTDIIVLIDEDKNNDGFWYATNSSSSTDQLTQVHNKGGNMLFADGHAKFFPYDVYPLDNSTTGLANKIRQTGSPRFYDRSFGVNGFWEPSPAPLGTCSSP